MKRSLKAVLVAGAVTAALAAPAAPAHAATCTGFVMENGELKEAGSWECGTPCPSPLYLFDGRFHVIVCVSPE